MVRANPTPAPTATAFFPYDLSAVSIALHASGLAAQSAAHPPTTTPRQFALAVTKQELAAMHVQQALAQSFLAASAHHRLLFPSATAWSFALRMDDPGEHSDAVAVIMSLAHA